LESAYAPTPNNIIPVVPGLPSAPELGIMDPYAGESCYAGMTLWWLMKALDHWPSAQATTSATTQPSSPPTTAPPAGKLPADSSHFVVGDLASSGLVWGRSGPVWWSVQGRRVCGGDPRCEQGLAAVKVWSQGRWRDLLALRPIQRGQTSQWELEFAHGYKVAPEFTSVSTTAHATTLHGIYRNPWGRRRPITWRIQTTATGVVVTMTPTLEAAVIAKIWLAPGAEAVPIAKAVPVTNKHPVVTPKAVFTPEAKTTTASGTATPMLLRWPAGALASVSISEE
jgi:hypothetical protein